MSESAITTGNLGQPWRASISPHGAVEPWNGERVDWYIAADDRWHVPASEPAVRQTRVAGTPVTETRVRVPTGDVVQRIFTTADAGGITVIEIQNESTLPVAIAFDSARLLTERAPADTPIEGIDLPEGSFVLPLGHAATLRVGLAHRATAQQRLPSLSDREQVVRGWRSILDRAGRYDLPDGPIGAGLVERVVAQRSELMLGAMPTAADDPIGFAIAIDQIVRLCDAAQPWIEELADAVEMIGPHQTWAADAALRAAHRVLVAADERRAANDLERIQANRRPSSAPSEPPTDLTCVAWLDERFAVGGQLLPGGIPEAWHGQSFEVYGVPTSGAATVGYGVRWHGERPAVLWEQGGSAIGLSAPTVDRSWKTNELRGEALWAAPSRAT